MKKLLVSLVLGVSLLGGAAIALAQTTEAAPAVTSPAPMAAAVEAAPAAPVPAVMAETAPAAAGAAPTAPVVACAQHGCQLLHVGQAQVQALA